ncbi:serine protease inhibitor Kazal-type 1-like [Glandiceps talaboti]
MEKLVLGLLFLATGMNARVIRTTTDNDAIPEYSPFCDTISYGCRRIFKPVCGSDDNTYANDCLLCQESNRVLCRTNGIHSVIIRHQGWCGNPQNYDNYHEGSGSDDNVIYPFLPSWCYRN